MLAHPQPGLRRKTARTIEILALVLFSVSHLVVVGFVAWFLIALAGAMAWHGVDGYSPSGPPHVPTWKESADKWINISWVVAAVYSVIVPIVRRRFDPLTFAGAIYIAATIAVDELWLMEPFPDERANGLHMFWWYTIPVVVPSVFIWLLVDRLKSNGPQSQP
jgi:hypothetical protein